MMKRLSIFLCVVAAAGVAGCGSDAPESTPTVTSSKPALKEGYRRYEVKPTMVRAGETVMSMEWMSTPMDRDMDVLDVSGWQSKSGHHAILYASVESQPVGTVRSWENADQITSRFIGGTGGEVGGQIKLPPGVVMRIYKGQSLFMQLHYMNTSTSDLMAESLVDVKMADASPERRVASFFSSTSLKYELPPGKATTMDFSCKLSADLPLIMYANHQHNFGVSVFTEQILPDGTRVDVKRDDRWQYEWAFNPNYSTRTVDNPLVLKAGTTLHTHCEWLNAGYTPLRFPDEMCVFLGFFLGEQDINCAAEGAAN
jgi:hypothetical protein